MGFGLLDTFCFIRLVIWIGCFDYQHVQFFKWISVLRIVVFFTNTYSAFLALNHIIFHTGPLLHCYMQIPSKAFRLGSSYSDL